VVRVVTDPDTETPGFRFVGETRLIKGWAISWARVRCVDPDGVEFERDVIRHPGAVAIVAVDSDRLVTLVRQFRAALGTAVLEIPAGTCDVPGESRELTARRELIEEAGLEANEVRLLADIHNAPGYSDQLTSIYLATGLRAVDATPEGVEEHWMAIERVPLDAVPELISRGRIHDATTMVGLQLAAGALKSHR
jgi:ADP-ribose pyrophosphatase